MVEVIREKEEETEKGKKFNKFAETMDGTMLENTAELRAERKEFALAHHSLRNALERGDLKTEKNAEQVEAAGGEQKYFQEKAKNLFEKAISGKTEKEKEQIASKLVEKADKAYEMRLPFSEMNFGDLGLKEEDRVELSQQFHSGSDKEGRNSSKKMKINSDRAEAIIRGQTEVYDIDEETIDKLNERYENEEGELYELVSKAHNNEFQGEDQETHRFAKKASKALEREVNEVNSPSKPSTPEIIEEDEYEAI